MKSGKCGKGWKPGLEGKCVRKPRRARMIGLGLAAAGAAVLGGAVAGGISVMRKKKGGSSGESRPAPSSGGMRGGGMAIVPYSATVAKSTPVRESKGQTPLLSGRSNAPKLLPPAGAIKRRVTDDDIRSALKKGLKRLPSREKMLRPQNMIRRLSPALKKARNANSVIESTWRRVKPRSL